MVWEVLLLLVQEVKHAHSGANASNSSSLLPTRIAVLLRGRKGVQNCKQPGQAAMLLLSWWTEVLGHSAATQAAFRTSSSRALPVLRVHPSLIRQWVQLHHHCLLLALLVLLLFLHRQQQQQQGQTPQQEVGSGDPSAV